MIVKLDNEQNYIDNTILQYHLINDSPSQTPNDISFHEPRHDQSLFSVLRKKYGSEMSDFDETWFGPNWTVSGDRYPFWSMRLR
jgi:hypothetical protein